MSQPPSNFDPTATLLPRVDAPISVQTGGAIYDTNKHVTVGRMEKKGEIQVGGEYSTEEQEILQKYSIGQKLQTQIGETTLREFIKQIQTPKCSAGAGAGILLHKDCWAVQAVITHLLRASLPGVVRKSNIDPDIRYETIPTSDTIDLSMEGFGGLFSSKEEDTKVVEVTRKRSITPVRKNTPSIVEKVPSVVPRPTVEEKKIDLLNNSKTADNSLITEPSISKENMVKEFETLAEKQRRREEETRRTELEATFRSRIDGLIEKHRDEMNYVFYNTDISLFQAKTVVPENETNYSYSIYFDRFMTILESLIMYSSSFGNISAQIENEKKFKTNETQYFLIVNTISNLQEEIRNLSTFIKDNIITIPYTSHDEETQKIADVEQKLKKYKDSYDAFVKIYDRPVEISPQNEYTYILENIRLLPGSENDTTTLRGRFTEAIEELHRQQLAYDEELQQHLETMNPGPMIHQPVDYSTFGEKVYTTRMYIEKLPTMITQIQEKIAAFEELEGAFLAIQKSAKKANIRSVELKQTQDNLTILRAIQTILQKESPSDAEIEEVILYNIEELSGVILQLKGRSTLTVAEKLRNRFTRKNKKNTNTGNTRNTEKNNGKTSEIQSRGRIIDGIEVGIIAIQQKINRKDVNYMYPKFLKDILMNYLNEIRSYQKKLVKRNINSFTNEDISEFDRKITALTELFLQIDILNETKDNIVNDQKEFLKKTGPSEYERVTRRERYISATEMIRNIVKMPAIEITVESINQLKQQIIELNDQLYNIYVFLQSEEAEREPEAPREEGPVPGNARYIRDFELLGIPEADRTNRSKYAKYYRKEIAKWHPNKHMFARNGESEEEHQRRMAEAREKYNKIQEAYDKLTGQAGGKGKNTRRNRKGSPKVSRKTTKKHHKRK